MNKFLLLGAAGILSVSVNAQTVQKKAPDQLSRAAAKFSPERVAPVIGVNGTPMAKSTATPFWTENFGSGTSTSLPTGWTAVGNGSFGGTWKWIKKASSGDYNIGTIQSTTASNGWMIYDSDSIGKTNPTATPLEGWLTSPSINCTGHNTVILNFQQYFARFRDTCYVEASNDNFATFTRFSVTPNNRLSSNGSTDNPSLATVNISNVAANQANVKFRFYYVGAYAGGSYNWLVDDVSLSEGNPVEVSIDHSSIVMRGSGRYNLFRKFPLSLVDTAFGVTFATNLGANTETPDFDYSVSRSGSPVYSYTRQLAIPTTEADSIVDFSEPYPGFYPNVIGDYTALFNTTLAGSANPNNGRDTASFTITDTVLSTHGDVEYYRFLKRPADPTTGRTEVSSFEGIQFSVPPGKSDTFTSASVSFGSNTTAGAGEVSVQIYKSRAASAGYDYVGTTFAKPIVASMVSPSPSNPTFTLFEVDNSTGVVVLDEGEYIAAVQINNVPAANTVSLFASTPLNSYLIPFTGYPGASDESDNDGAFNFSPSSLAVGTSYVPFIELHFKGSPAGVKNTATNFELGAARPNPAQAEFAVPVTPKVASEVSVLLTNPMGQVVANQNLGKVAAGQTATAVFNTAALANGVYFYTVQAGAERVTNRIVVAH